MRSLAERPTASSLWRSHAVGTPVHGVVAPVLEGGFLPAAAAVGNPGLGREAALLDLPVECRAAQAGALEHFVEADEGICGHKDNPFTRCRAAIVARKAGSLNGANAAKSMQKGT